MVAELPAFPYGHLPVMLFAWISFSIFINLVFALLRRKNRHMLTKSPVYTILLFSSIGDVCMFFHTELLMRPRKYRFFNLFTGDTPVWLAYFSYFTLCMLRLVMLLSYIPLAVNRFTAFAAPVLYKKIWRVHFILAYTVFIWIFAALSTLAIFCLPTLVELRFELLPNGVLQILTGDLFLKDAIEVAAYSFSVCLLCSLFYLAGAITSRKVHAAPAIERKLFLCCVLASIPLLMDCAKASLLLYGTLQNNMDIILLATELHFYWAEVMTSVQGWSLLLITPSARRLVLHDGLFASCFHRKKHSITVIVSHSL